LKINKDLGKTDLLRNIITNPPQTPFKNYSGLAAANFKANFKNIGREIIKKNKK